MADKVQFLLEDVLHQSIFLTKKGVFSQGELHQQMINRERFQNGLIKNTIKVTDFLKSIEYEYQLERIRRYRVSKESEFKLHPKFKKADTKDFTIVKRIINLWDRTLHKYKYRIDLWKQYLSFCYVIKSKKTFYKALSNAIKFNPFELDLWLAGVYYELEVYKNPWKGRKLFHKALKVNKKNQQFYCEYLKYQLLFCTIILKREEIINKDKDDDLVIKFGETQENNDNNIEINAQNDTNFGKLLEVIIIMSFENCQKKEILLDNIIKILKQSQEKQQILKNTINVLLGQLQTIIKEKISDITPENQLKKLLQINHNKYSQQLLHNLQNKNNTLQQKISFLSNFQNLEEKKLQLKKLKPNQLLKDKVLYYDEWATFMVQQNKIQLSVLDEIINELMFHSQELQNILEKIIGIDAITIFRKLINKKLKFPPKILKYYLNHFEQYTQISPFQINLLVNKMRLQDLGDKQVLKGIVNYNKKNNRQEENIKILKGLNILHGKNNQLSKLIMRELN